MSSTIALLILLALPNVLANPLNVSFTDCFDSNGNTSLKLSISSVYAQVLEDDQQSVYLNLTVLGDSPQEIVGYSNTSLNLATLFTSTSVLTLSAWSNSSYLCAPLRPPSPLPAISDGTSDYCPISAGPFAFSSQIPWGSHRALTTLTTRLRAVDTFSNELLCLDVATTPLDPSSSHNPYGRARIIFWATVALAIAYWIVVGIARIVSAWNRGNTRPGRGLWGRAQSAGFILASAVSGERLASSPALMRFCTPSLRDIIFHTQWCAALCMVAVQWPDFVYPLLSQTAWATLSYNVTLTQGGSHHWDPLSSPPYNPPANFADQFSDPSSSIYIDPDVPNILFSLPDNSTSGISKFAYTVGVRSEDLFGICLIIFLSIAAGAVVLSIVVGLLDRVATFIGGLFGSRGPGPAMTRHSGARSPAFASKDMLATGANPNVEEAKSLNGHDALLRPSSRFGLSGTTGATTRKSWWKWRSNITSFHSSVLQGNLVRILVLFHLPVTIFSSYQMILPRSTAALSSIVLAALSFAIFSILIPAILVIRVRLTTTNKLYDETRTLLALGPLYNHYRHGSQMFASLFFMTNVAFGVTVGAGQASGTAQAIVILVIEVGSALVTSIWLPWGTGASMGLISFLFCVARIVVAVLLVILSPTINIGSGAGGWVAYGILIILALVYLALLLMLIVKLIEAFVRIVGGVGFERSSHAVDSGLLGACGLAGCCGRRRRRRRRDGNKSSTSGRTSRSAGGYKAADGAPSRKDSDSSSYLPPAGMNNADSTSKKGSIHSGPPPSVLRPEHALRPYREDSDDENGYIMGAWQPFATQQPGYAQLNAPAPISPPKVQSSGFSRVGGGRAHIDSPYAISAGSTHTFPSVDNSVGAGNANASAATLNTSRLRYESYDTAYNGPDTPLPLSSNNAMRQQQEEAEDRRTALPPGAMQPLHQRTKSQTAIIEDAGPLVSAANVGNASRPVSNMKMQDLAPSSFHPPTGSMAADDDTDSEFGQPKKKAWYHIRRSRPRSSEGNPGAGNASTSQRPTDEEAALEGPASSSPPPPTRSFVVVRKPQVSPGRSLQISGGSGSPNAMGQGSPTPTRDTFKGGGSN